jgi:hypothetical protein
MPKGCISVMVSEELEAKLRKAATEDGRTLSNYVGGILERAHPAEGGVFSLTAQKQAGHRKNMADRSKRLNDRMVRR